MTGILVFFHCASNSGFAISRLEGVFFDVARTVTDCIEDVHFAYPDLSAGAPQALPRDFGQVLRFDPGVPGSAGAIAEYVRRHGIGLALGFDQPVRQPGYAGLRQGGVRTFVSYWGAPMSSVNSGFKLALKRLDVRLARGSGGPDHYVFESAAMQRTAVDGRGVPAAQTSVTYLGVDEERFRPTSSTSASYAHATFGIPAERRIVYYSGHMEKRKGVDVLVRAAVELVDVQGIENVHFLILGNRPGEEAAFHEHYRGRAAERHITFGGYRDDVERIIPDCYVGAIASTGWDSFTMSSLEIAACGLPLIVSRLQGLVETVVDGETGFTFPVGDPVALAERVRTLIEQPERRDRMGAASRARVVSGFTRAHQVRSLAETIRRVDATTAANMRA